MHAAPQGQGPPCCQSGGAGGMLHSCASGCISQHLPIPQWLVVGMLFLPPCHLNGLSGVSMAVYAECLSPALFSQDKLEFTSSGLIKPLVSKTVSHLGSWTRLLPPNILPAESNEKNSWRWWDVRPSHSPPSTMTWRDKPGEFCQVRFVLLVVIWPSLIRAQLKETYGPRFCNATDLELSHVKRLNRWNMVFYTSFHWPSK